MILTNGKDKINLENPNVIEGYKASGWVEAEPKKETEEKSEKVKAKK